MKNEVKMKSQNDMRTGVNVNVNVSNNVSKLHESKLEKLRSQVAQPNFIEPYNASNPVRRWEKLYTFNKIKIEKRNLIEREGVLIKGLNEIQGCTFTPSISSKLKDKIQSDDSTLSQRRHKWSNVKKIKVEMIRRLEEEKLQKTLIFKPEIKTNPIFLRQNKSTEKILVHNNSYSNFIHKSQDLRAKLSREKSESNLKPGSGKIWNANNSITIPKTFNFRTESRGHRKNNSVASLDYSSNNLNVLNTSYLNTNQSTSTNEKCENQQNQHFTFGPKHNRIKSVKISPCYTSAIGQLHQILHKINL